MREYKFEPVVLLSNDGRLLSIDDLVQLSASFFGYTLSDFLGRNRKPNLIRSKSFFFTYLNRKKILNITHSARHFCYDHATIINRLNKATGWMEAHTEDLNIYNDYIDFMERNVRVELKAKMAA